MNRPVESTSGVMYAPGAETNVVRRRIGVRWSLVIPGLIVAAYVIAAVFAAQLAPYSHTRVSFDATLRPPSFHGHLLGTNQVGIDELSQLLFALRASLIVAFGATLISCVIGIALGLLAGTKGGPVDRIISALIDLQMSIPGILIVIVLVFVLGPGLKTTLIVLGVVGWVTYARMSRAESMAVMQQPYVLAARSTGCSFSRITIRHVLPNVANSLIVLSTLQFAGNIIAEAGISFLGFGVQPPSSSLGLMISNGRTYLSVAWWLVVVPGAAIFVLVFAVNALGDGLQSFLDPVRRRAG